MSASIQPSSNAYRDVDLLIAGSRRPGLDRISIIDPSTEQVIGSVAKASAADLDEALAAAEAGFRFWKREATAKRAEVLIRAASLLRERIDEIATDLTREQGRVLAQSRLEIALCAETFEWFAGEALRNYGRILPARIAGARQMVVPEPIGPVVALTPWNFPALLAARKIAPAIAAGCSVILKPAEETPACAFALGQALLDAGLPKEVLSIVFGDPGQISSHLIDSAVIRKITFTGSVPVGKLLAAQAGRHAKPCTLELGGHAPVIVAEDADVAAAAAISAIGKTRNAGQVCTSPTRFYVQQRIRDEFVERFAANLNGITVGDGLDPSSDMGALANERRLLAMQDIVNDARSRGAEVVTGGNRIGNRGYFFQPTLLTSVAGDALAMQTEPFGPIAIVSTFDDLDEGIALANQSPVGLAGYAFTRSAGTAVRLQEELEVGMVGINSFAVSHTEAPFGGVKDSGYGYEGGLEGFAGYVHHKYVNHVGG
ncbi:NAD-dependent succinate-semialdehyde dehydrogenase [Bosea vaviloviae]|uniref:NAD-dependent succinate-semialdehyde dehydrogenase n=1 Tax=Bosea vaviloviae TaxID=1526658 RepID=UPI0006BB26BF|nr:NAD-dependent succinate-semialdehyde dehydrogenase [Bosea vaviloviae]